MKHVAHSANCGQYYSSCLGVNYLWAWSLWSLWSLRSTTCQTLTLRPLASAQSHMRLFCTTDARKLAIVMVTVAIVTGAILAEVTSKYDLNDLHLTLSTTSTVHTV